MPVSIRLATPSDVPRLVEFNRNMARETEGKELDHAVVTAGVTKLFQAPELGFYVVAEVNRGVAGCLMITYEWSDWRNRLFWWIQSVYVRPEHRRQGLYRRLHEYICSLAAEKGNICGVRLLVEKNNTRAQNTYSAMGMDEAHYKMFEQEF